MGFSTSHSVSHCLSVKRRECLTDSFQAVKDGHTPLKISRAAFFRLALTCGQGAQRVAQGQQRCSDTCAGPGTDMQIEKNGYIGCYALVLCHQKVVAANSAL